MTRNLSSIYLEGMAVRIADLEDVKARLETEGEEALAALMRMAHSLKGSGATYGFPSVSEAAAALEGASESGRAEALARLLATLGSAGDEAPTPTSNRRVLVATADGERAAAIAAPLTEGGVEVLLRNRGDEALEAASEPGFDLALVDVVLPDRDGRLVLRDLADRGGAPVLALSGVRDDSLRNECLAMGASACLDAPSEPGVIASEVLSRLEAMPRLAAPGGGRDRLTGLMGRGAFAEIFDRMVALGSRKELPGTVALIDVDHLARINHEAGTEAGDRLLARLGRLLERRLRRCDVPARWGGEEFAVLFPATEENEARRALERILDEFKETPAHEGGDAPATFSAGVAPVRPDDSPAGAVARADWFLFYAKSEGRDRVLCSSDKLASRPARSVLLVEDDEDAARLVRNLLEEHDVQVVHREDGEAGLGAFLKGGYDLAIVDIRMPRMDGLELLDRIRRSSTDADLPVLLLTGEGSEADIVRGFARGADDYVVKPFRGEELMARVRRLLPRETRHGH